MLEHGRSIQEGNSVDVRKLAIWLWRKRTHSGHGPTTTLLDFKLAFVAAFQAVDVTYLKCFAFLSASVSCPDPGELASAASIVKPTASIDYEG
jgi:hypothetical protein